MKASPSISYALEVYRRAYLNTPSYAPRTRREYLTDLLQLGEYLRALGVRAVRAVSRTHLEMYLAHLDQAALQVPTRRRKVAAIRSFFRFLDEAGARAGDPAEKLLPPEVDERVPRYLTEVECQRLRAAATINPRDAALIELLLQTGMRLSEVSHPAPAHRRRAVRSHLRAF